MNNPSKDPDESVDKHQYKAEEQSSSPKQPGVVTPLTPSGLEAHAASNKSPKNKTLGLSRIIVIVCTLLVIVLILSMLLQESTNKKIKDEMETVTQQSAELITQYKYDEAISVWQEFLAQPLPSEIKCEADLRFSNVYLESGKYQEASTRFQEVKNGCTNEVDDLTLYLGLAKSHDGFGDTNNSIENYQKVIDIEKRRQQNPPKDFDRELSEKNVARYVEIIEVLRLNL